MIAVDVMRKLVAEALGTGLLVTTVIGSGIMASRLSGDGALALLGNAIPTGAILFVLISILGPVSGAHFNPVVSLVFVIRGALPLLRGAAYAVAQVAGGVTGAMLAHAMFDLPLFQASETVRTGAGQWLAECLATFGLVLTILGGLRSCPAMIAQLVALYIAAAYWFTSSTSFANPAVAVARALSDTFAGIRPLDVPTFVVAETAGAILALSLCGWLFHHRRTT